MQQRDILKDQIDQLGRVIGKVLAEFLGLKTKGDVMQGFEISNQILKQKTNISVADIEEMNEEDFLSFLDEHPFSSNSLEILGDYLSEVGHYKKGNSENAKRFFQHANTAYEQANHRSDEYSMQRAAKQQSLSKLI